ncbi:cytoplasmic phosphatidylinositol transfer protein 1-like, partial [Heterodontus francisci]|uniref:cytoplasmic phosphatidylinositol transfer protein 1-like n=1 Tax=Heterodontus francisci TaxID=7792 RepID=UPI00355BEAEF
LNSKLPHWVRTFIPNIFYITEKSWNYYPYTLTEYTCSFLPKFSVRIKTQFEDNNGCNNNVFNREPTPSEQVSYVDILSDEFPQRYYKESEDPRTFRSVKTSRGPLFDGWRESHKPIMCSYKLVTVKFEMYGLQSRVEQLVHKNIREILLVGHRQAFAWIDEWFDMSVENVREYERESQRETNQKVSTAEQSGQSPVQILVNTPCLPSNLSPRIYDRTPICEVSWLHANAPGRAREDPGTSGMAGGDGGRLQRWIQAGSAALGVGKGRAHDSRGLGSNSCDLPCTESGKLHGEIPLGNVTDALESFLFLGDDETKGP